MMKSEAKRFADAYHDCKLVADSIVDDETFQKADSGLVLGYMREILEALSEIQQYRAICSVSELRELKEKATAKKPIDVRYFGEAGHYIGLCPTCKSGNNSEYEYCGDCGQKLDWSEGKE